MRENLLYGLAVVVSEVAGLNFIGHDNPFAHSTVTTRGDSSGYDVGS